MIELYATKEQLEIIQDKSRVQVVVAGRRWGKTFTIRNHMLSKAFEKAGSELWYVPPSYALSHKQYRAFVGHSDLRRFIRRAPVQPYPQIELVNGSTLGFRSADRPLNLRGAGNDGVWVDEAAHQNETFVWEVLRPTLSDRRGTLHLHSTFHGQNWFYEWYMRGTRRESGARAWFFPTRTGIQFQGEDGRRELELVRSQVPAAVWEQEYECKASANSSAALKWVDSCIEGEAIAQGQQGKHYIIGYDSGKTHDPGAVVVVETDSGLVAQAVGFPLGMSYDKQVAEVNMISQKFKGANVIVDSTGAGTRDAIVDFIRQRVANCRGLHFKGRRQEQIVNQLDLDMQQGRLKIPRSHAELLRQCRDYEYRYSGQFLTYGAPEGGHDDFVAALSMANWARTRGWSDEGGTALSAAFQ